VQKYLEAEDAVLAVQAAGSVRRSKETVHDIDVVVSTKKPNDVMDAFVAMDPEAEILGKGETKSSVRMKNGLQVDCRCVSPKQYPHALQHFTGSKEHNIQVRARARKMGLKVSEWGLFDADDEDNEKPIYCKDEAGIYKKLGLEYIPPELREGLDELTWAEDGEVPDLLEEKQIKGLLHCHSTYSDGKNSLEEMARACHDLGMSYLGICDHSQAAFYANGLNPDRVKKQWDEIDELNDKFTEELDGFRILKGIEADILPSGDLDFHDDGDLLDGFELVVASIHGNFNFSKEDQTKRVLSALENPAVTILGHPTGRLLTTRKSYDIDLEEIIEKAVELGVAIEINASPYRLDLDWRWGEQARKHGLHTAICPDAHNVNGLEDFRFGVGIARKAAYAPDHVLNTRSAKDLLKFSNARK
jgi:DNA polymerase (family 10)